MHRTFSFDQEPMDQLIASLGIWFFLFLDL